MVATLGWDHEPGNDMHARPMKKNVLHKKGPVKVKPTMGFWIVLWVNWFLKFEKVYNRTAAQADDYVCSIQWKWNKKEFYTYLNNFIKKVNIQYRRDNTSTNSLDPMWTFHMWKYISNQGQHLRILPILVRRLKGNQIIAQLHDQLDD